MKIYLVSTEGTRTAILSGIEDCCGKERDYVPELSGALAVRLSEEEIKCLEGKGLTVRPLRPKEDDSFGVIRAKLTRRK